ncbi:MAG: hypothetical protein P1V51_03730 [Deltaproteobacteria bacterium]|nr:hypothetical protein [Deltaproteobacteria bacterium]
MTLRIDRTQTFRALLALILMTTLAACSGSGGGGGGDAGADGGADGGTDGGSTGPYALGGTVMGLVGALVLQNQGADDLRIEADGPFAFSTRLDEGTAFAVTLLSDPLLQNCAVSGAEGVMGTEDVTTVEVTCEDKRWYPPASLEDSISPPSTTVRGARVVMNAGGDALVAWQQSEGGTLRLLLSERTGGTWTHPQTLAESIAPTGGLGLIGSSPVQVALGDDGQALLAWLQDDGSTACGGASCRQIYRSERGSGGWTHPASLGDRISLAGLNVDTPRLVLDDAGDATILWASSDGEVCGTFSCSRIFRSERTSGVWVDPLVMATDAMSPPSGRAREPRIAADGAGNRLASWLDEEAGNSCVGNYPCFQLYLATRDSGGWTVPTDRTGGIAPDGQHVMATDLAVSPGGQALVVWQQSDGNRMQIYVSHFDGTVWSHPMSLSESLGPTGLTGSSPRVVMDHQGHGLLVWRQTDGSVAELHGRLWDGSAWSAPERFSLPGSALVGTDGREVDLALAVDDHENRLVAWAQEDESSDCGGGPCSQIYVSEFRRGAWHHPATLADHLSLAGQPANEPGLATDDDGNALLVWTQEDGLPGCLESTCRQTFLAEYR